MSSGYRDWILGSSTEGRELRVRAFAPQGRAAEILHVPGPASWPWLLFLGGVHGDELEGVWLMEEIEHAWSKSYLAAGLGALVWSSVNPDGISRPQRANARGIDLNRNLPTRDWTAEVKNPRYFPGTQAGSEPENQALTRIIDVCKPMAILSAHSFSKVQVNINGPSREWGERLSALCGYPVTEDIGYPTPGCLGTYAGAERGIPTITLEIERGLPKERVLEMHLPLIQASLDYWRLLEKRNLRL
ncbi:MAG: M14 family zinc carboxypeptidase [Oligoflexia bacterium]|nr:M14 family zinc carboxypeptidase [Oligoflexia bacterium]